MTLIDSESIFDILPALTGEASRLILRNTESLVSS